MDVDNKAFNPINFKTFKAQVLSDYQTIVLSRECSYLGRREVLSGKAKFGIFGDGKELPQVALNRFFEKGDFRSGYYRDQTLLLAQGHLNPSQIFAALYADLDIEREPMSGGRQMGGHFTTRSVSETGEWLSLVDQKNHSSDISPTAGQVPRMVGLAQASKIYRNQKIKDAEKFSKEGNEIVWGTIGNASTSEGLFFEAVNAAGVLQIPLVISVWDDGYGISVDNKEQTTKESISKALKGFQRNEQEAGLEILEVKGWDYPALIQTYEHASKLARKEHIPVLVHVTELTQPLGHSTSGSHERYKSQERLQWEKDFDCNVKMREWILSNSMASPEELEVIEKDCKELAKQSRKEAWLAYQAPILEEKKKLVNFLQSFVNATNNAPALQLLLKQIAVQESVGYKDVVSVARQATTYLAQHPQINKEAFNTWLQELRAFLNEKISSKLYAAKKEQLIQETGLPPEYSENAELVDGRVVVRNNFEALLKQYDTLLIFGEDVGKIGDVNQGLEGLQQKFGQHRIADTGIREATIIGQGIGMAMRGLRPIAEIQYLDYILYCIHTLSDDLATMSYRTYGKQIAPMIVRTRGHRLEGIWHSGSPMGGLLHLLRGVHLLVPRNLTQASGFYNMLLQMQQPALVIEPLNGYRLKERLPNNLGSFKIPLGKIEVLRKGTDITVVSYGSTLRLVEAAAVKLQQYGIAVEVIDVQTLIPFDLREEIKNSVTKTNRLLIVDEDVPGGASSYILQQILEKQNVFPVLDSVPKLVSAKAHRPAYGTDGDYFSKPSVDDIFEAAYAIMHESNPKKFLK